MLRSVAFHFIATSVAVSLVLSPSAHGQTSIPPKIRFGPEWTFANRDTITAGRNAGEYRIATQRNAESRDQMFAAFMERCPTCRWETRPNRHIQDEPVFKIFADENTWIEIDIDPYVVEVNASPETEADFRTHRTFFESVFEAARKIALAPHRRIGGGHIHIDFETAFGGDEKLARNFIVDLMNRPELALGGLGRDLLNGPPLAIQSPEQIETFKKILLRYDTGEINFDTFIDQINESVYNRTYDWFQPVPAQKYQAINLTRAKSNSRPRTLELRMLRPQGSFEEFLILLRLFESRIETLRQTGGRIELHIDRQESTEQNDSTSVEAVIAYGKAAKLSLNDIRPLLDPHFDVSKKKVRAAICGTIFRGRAR